MFSYELLSIPADITLTNESLDAVFLWVAKHVPHAQNGIINIAFIDDELMQTLNREYRWIDKTTDVLSFHYFDEYSIVTEDEVAGEIVLSYSKVLSQALEHGHTKEKETQILVLHALLHILGLDHESDEDYKIMWKYEEKIRSLITPT